MNTLRSLTVFNFSVPFICYKKRIDSFGIYPVASCKLLTNSSSAPNVVLKALGENFQSQYKAIAHYDNNDNVDVTGLASWVVEPDMYASIDANGLLVTGDIETFQNVTVSAQYTQGDITVQADKVITIFALCPPGTALDFDGVNDYIDCGNFAQLDGEKAFTIAFWIKADELPFPAHDGIVARGSRYQRTPWIWGCSGEAYISMQFETDTGGALDGNISTPNLTQGKWHHIVMTWNGSTVTAYMDSIATATDSTISDTLANTDASLKIGHIIPYGYLNGSIDDVRIYDRALSAEEIQANTYIPLQGDEPNLVGYWDFNEGEGQVAHDLSDNGNHGYLGRDPCDIDDSDPTWVASDAPVGLCSPYLIAKRGIKIALKCKIALLEKLQAALAQEAVSLDALDELLESGDYGDLKKNDVVKAKQKVHSAIQDEERLRKPLEKSVGKLQDSLSALGCEPVQE